MSPTPHTPTPHKEEKKEGKETKGKGMWCVCGVDVWCVGVCVDVSLLCNRHTHSQSHTHPHPHPHPQDGSLRMISIRCSAFDISFVLSLLNGNAVQQIISAYGSFGRPLVINQARFIKFSVNINF